MASVVDWQRSEQWHRFAWRLLALVVGVTGLVDILSILAPRMPVESWLSFWPFEVEATLHQLTLIVGFFLLMLSRGLARGKRQAWQVTVGMLLLSALLHGGGHIYPLMFAPDLVALIGLILVRPLFHVRSDQSALLRGSLILALGMLLAGCYAIEGQLSLSSQLIAALHIESQVHAILTRFAYLRHLLLSLLPLLSLSVLLVGLAQMLWPVVHVLGTSAEERSRAALLIRRYGENSISFFGLTPEKVHFFSSDGQGVLSYRLVGRVAVVAGDPCAPPQGLARLVREFAEFCARQDWHMVFWQVRAELLPIYRQLGLQALKIGEEAVLDTQRFTLAGGPMQNVRAILHRAEKAGLKARFFRGMPPDPGLRAQLEQLSATWLAAKGGVEMGFSMGRFAEQDDPEVTTAVALDEQERVHAVVTFVPVYGRQGWALDLMRRAQDATPGAIELLIVRALEEFRAAGAQMVSLGLAPQANTTGEPENTVEQSISAVTSRIRGLRTASSLFFFKRKFQPRWESRYLIYPSMLSLPSVGWALLRAHVAQSWWAWLAPLRPRLPAAPTPASARAAGS